jgi:hypothetical protein
MEHMSYDELAVLVLLGKGTAQQKQAKLAQLTKRANNEVACPDCGHEGPHDDNGERGEEFALGCTGCGMAFQPEPVRV